jgi:hypothetical protein
MTMRLIAACHWSPGIHRVQPADVGGAGAHRGGVVGHAEVQRLQPAAELGDFDIGHAQRGLDQRLKPTRVW